MEEKNNRIDPDLLFLLQDTVTAGVNERSKKSCRGNRNAESISR